MITKKQLQKIQQEQKAVKERLRLYKEFMKEIEDSIDRKLENHYEQGSTEDCKILIWRLEDRFHQLCNFSNIKFDKDYFDENLIKLMKKYEQNGITVTKVDRNAYTFGI